MVFKMDRTQLNIALNKFLAYAAKNGYPLENLCLEEAFPGDVSTSYIVHITAPWVSSMTCSAALDILIDFLWITIEEQDRRQIFSLSIHDENQKLPCVSEQVFTSIATE